MLHLIAYDVANARRLHRVARICEDYGVRIEKSVFECNLDEGRFQELWSRLSAIVTDADSIIDYPIGLLDQKRIMTLGGATRNDPENTYVF